MTSSIRRCLAAAAIVVLAFAGAASAAERRVVVADPAPPLAGAAAAGPLTGYLTAPVGAGPFPAVALIHSCLGLPENRAAFAATLASWGYVALYVDEFAPRGLHETCSVDFPVGPADAAAALAFLARQPFVDARRARRRRLLAGRRRRARARRLAAARRALTRRRRLLPALRQPSGRDAHGSDPHLRRRGRFGDAGRGLSSVRRRAAAGRRRGAARRSARRRPSVRRSRFRRRPGRSGHAFRLRPRRGGARRTGIASISGEDIVADGRGRLTPARGCARPSARRASSARAFQSSFRHGIRPTGPLDCGPRAGRCGGRHAETRIPHRRGGDAGRPPALADPPSPFQPDLWPPMNSRGDFVAWMQAHRGEDPVFSVAAGTAISRCCKFNDLWTPNDKRAFLFTPRQEFVLPEDRDQAYVGHYLDIGFGVTITPPGTMGRMTSALNLKPGERVLEVGTGSGYQSALLSYLTSAVYDDRDHSRARRAHPRRLRPADRPRLSRIRQHPDQPGRRLLRPADGLAVRQDHRHLRHRPHPAAAAAAAQAERDHGHSGRAARRAAYPQGGQAGRRRRRDEGRRAPTSSAARSFRSCR